MALATILGACVLGVAARAVGGPSDGVCRRSGVRLGATISASDIEWLNGQLGTRVTPRQALEDAKRLGLSIVRIGIEWDHVQRDEASEPDFSAPLAVVQAAQDAGLEVVLTVGMKAPHNPEFYIPSWAEPSQDQDEVSRDGRLRGRTLAFIEKTVRAFQGFSAISAWQVENEPLNRAGESGYGPSLPFFGRRERRWIGADFLAEEVALVRRLDSRRVVINFWSDDERVASAPWTDSDYAKRNALSIGDVIGLDVYPSEGGAPDFGCDRVVKIPREWRATARAAGKEAWIMEAQAEYWGSYSPSAEDVKRLLDIEIDLGYRTIFLWGFEWMESLRQSSDPAQRAHAQELLEVVASYTGGEVEGLPSRDLVARRHRARSRSPEEHLDLDGPPVSEYVAPEKIHSGSPSETEGFLGALGR